MSKEKKELAIDEKELLTEEKVCEIKDTQDEFQYVTIHHKTPYETYRRAGLVLTQVPREYRVSKEQREELEQDDYVEVRS